MSREIECWRHFAPMSMDSHSRVKAQRLGRVMRPGDPMGYWRPAHPPPHPA